MQRRMWVALLVTFVLLVPAGTVSAKTVVNESGTLTQLAAEWWEDDGESWTYGYAVATTMNRDTWIDFYEGTTTPIPGDPMCWEETYTSAWGPGTLVAGKKYETGHAEGVLEGYTYTYQWCEGDWEDEIEPMNGGGEEWITLDVAIDFTANTPLYREKGSGSFKLPSELNEHYRYSSEYRYGDASVTIDGATVPSEWAVLGSVKYSYHSNSK